jgi:hypothetical protein
MIPRGDDAEGSAACVQILPVDVDSNVAAATSSAALPSDMTWANRPHGLIELRDGRLLCGGEGSLWLLEPPESAPKKRTEWQELPNFPGDKHFPKLGHPMPVGYSRVLCLTLLEDGRVACGNAEEGEDSVTVWNMEREACEMRFGRFGTYVSSISQGRGSVFLACGCGDGLIRILSLESGECVRTLEAFTATEYRKPVWVDWSLGHRLLGTCAESAQLLVWRGRSPSELEREREWDWGDAWRYHLERCIAIDDSHALVNVTARGLFLVDLEGVSAPRCLVRSCPAIAALPFGAGMMMLCDLEAARVVCAKRDLATLSSMTLRAFGVSWDAEVVVSRTTGVMIIRHPDYNELHVVSIHDLLPHSLRYRLLAWRRGFVEARSRG